MQNKGLDFPPIVNLGIYRGACQCKCVHCPIGITDMGGRKKAYGHSEIELNLFQLFCSEVKAYKTTVRLHAVGEPTLHSQFVELLQTIREFDLKHKFWIFTNGLFKSSLIPDLVETMEIVEVSINSTNAEDYRQTKGVDCFRTALRNVYRMRDWIEKRSLTTRIVLTKVQSTQAEDQEFIRFWSERNFECFVRSFHTYSGILPALHATLGKLETPKCLVPWRRFNLDGTIARDHLVAVNCFNILFQNPENIDSHCVMGFFPDLSLSELWNGSALQKLRSEMELGLPTLTPCDHCTECLTNVGPRAENLISLHGN